MLTESEPWRPPRQYLDLLERLAQQISPDDPGLDKWFHNYCAQHRSRLAADLHILDANLPAPVQLLEYGAAPLLMTAALAEMGYKLTALDLAPGRFSKSIETLNLDVRRCDVEVEPVPFADASFDAVLFNELFEHLRINPIQTLREVHRVLKPGGMLFLSTPNLRSARGIRNLLLRNQGHSASGDPYVQYRKLEELGHMGHVREYTTREVAEFLGHVGFRVERLIFRGGEGRGLSGAVQRLIPSLRPFFTIIASKPASATAAE